MNKLKVDLKIFIYLGFSGLNCGSWVFVSCAWIPDRDLTRASRIEGAASYSHRVLFSSLDHAEESLTVGFLNDEYWRVLVFVKMSHWTGRVDSKEPTVCQ